MSIIPIAWPEKSVLGKDSTEQAGKAVPYEMTLKGGWVHDVNIVDPQHNQSLIYDSISGVWSNVPNTSKSLRIQSDSLVFVSSTQGNISPDYIRIEAKRSNIEGEVQWTSTAPLYASPTGGSATTFGDIVYLRSASMSGITTLQVQASVEDTSDGVSFTDETTLVKVTDGGSALMVVLSNPTHGMPTNVLGVSNPMYSGTTIQVYEGAVLLNITSCTPVGTFVTPGEVSGLDTTTVTIGNHSAITEDNAKVTYTILVTRSGNISSSLIAVQTLFKAKESVTYDVEIESTNGNIFKPGQFLSTTLIAHVFKNDVEVTDIISASRFLWRRVSYSNPAYPNDDTTWNQTHSSGFKTINISFTDVEQRATFHCDIQES